MDYQLTQTGQEVQNILDQAPITQQDLNAEISEREGADTVLQENINAEQSAREGADTQINGRINGINELIPEQASPENQLADQSFVNSSVGTNTAYYISDNGQPFSSLADLEAYSGQLTNNDYAFVVGTDAAGNTTYTRYKYNANTQEWAEEYVLNNSSFTAAQWAAISSGITSADVAKLSLLPTKEQLDELFAAKQNVIPDLNAIRSGAAKGSTAYQKPASGIPQSDLAEPLRDLAWSRMWVVNFGESADTVQFTNLYGGIRISRFAGVNVDSVKVTYGNVIEQVIPMGTTTLNIEYGQVVTLEIIKTSELQPSVLSTKFQILTDQA